jgi:hypothetical protein
VAVGEQFYRGGESKHFEGLQPRQRQSNSLLGFRQSWRRAPVRCRR